VHAAAACGVVGQVQGRLPPAGQCLTGTVILEVLGFSVKITVKTSSLAYHPKVPLSTSDVFKPQHSATFAAA
jgi:hypothetical protein